MSLLHILLSHDRWQKWAGQFTPNFENVPALLTMLAAVTSSQALGRAATKQCWWCWKKRENKSQIHPCLCSSYARGHSLLCDCRDHGVSAVGGNPQSGSLQWGTTFWGCLTLSGVWQARCLYNTNTRLMLLGNSTHERSGKFPDMPNETSAKYINCRLQNIFLKEKDGREERVRTERGRDKQRTDGLRQDRQYRKGRGIRAEGGRGCEYIWEDCST